MSLAQLSHFGAEPVADRVVIDRNRVTGGGVTSGIDFALTLCASIFGDERAKLAQLTMEYDPHPPFNAGSPDLADAVLVERIRNSAAEFQKWREEAAKAAAKSLGL